MQTMDFDGLEEINRRCCSVIWHMATESRDKTSDFCLHALSPRLIIPEYRKGTHRVSEQEARFAFVEALSGTSTHYSVETPTRCDYSFTSPSGSARSAQTDLTLYLADTDGFRRWANVEFKADIPAQPQVDKDIEKLVREQANCATVGNWFHLLENTNRGTLKKLFEKVSEALKSFVVDHRVDVLFCVCVLGTRTAHLRRYSGPMGAQSIDAFFQVDAAGVPGADWTHYSF